MVIPFKFQPRFPRGRPSPAGERPILTGLHAPNATGRAEARLLLLLAAAAGLPAAAAEAPFAVAIKIDASRPKEELKPIWRFFGADEPNYATMKDGRKLLAELGHLGPHQVYFRAHNLLTTGDGTPALKWGSTNAYTEDAEGRALPTARVGGPDTAGGGGPFLRGFLEHCLRGTNHATGAKGTPIDFLSFHAKGAPKFLDGHVQMGIANQLQTIDGAMAIIASFPELKGKPIVIGETDPEGCAPCQGPQLGYRNGTMYSSYTAASFARKHDLAAKHGVNLEGALTWAFEFEDQPYFAGFRALASNGLDLPVLNVFRMFGKMGGRRLAVQSSADPGLEAMMKDGVRGTPDVSALASLEPRKLSVLLWHYHDDDVAGPDAAVELSVSGLPLARGEARLQHYRIDETHSNSFAAWKRIGSPLAPDEKQYA